MAKKKPRRMCATMEVHNRLVEEDPKFRARLTKLEHATARTMLAKAAPPKLRVIRVVVHVVYNVATENISITQVKNQIKVLNLDFRAKNPDKSTVPAAWKGLVADAMVEFKLASKDPTGKPTSGITRTKTTETSFSSNNDVKFKSRGGVNAWPTKKYLNIWVCNLGGGLLGYAQFPGGPPKSDGVVINYTAFGTGGTAQDPFQLGRTATHEIGHFFNLRHIWGDTEDCSGSDLVSDTPNAEGPNTGKPTFPSVSCGNGPNGDMFMNYMDYVDDDTMVMFTSQQAVRMWAALSGPRSSLKV